MSAPREQQLPAATLRELAVLAEVDPRSIRRAYEGREVRGLAGIRAKRVLRQHGYILAPSSDRVESAGPSQDSTVGARALAERGGRE